MSQFKQIYFNTWKRLLKVSLMGGLSCFSCTEFKGTAKVPCPGKWQCPGKTSNFVFLYFSDLAILQSIRFKSNTNPTWFQAILSSRRSHRTAALGSSNCSKKTMWPKQISENWLMAGWFTRVTPTRLAALQRSIPTTATYQCKSSSLLSSMETFCKKVSPFAAIFAFFWNKKYCHYISAQANFSQGGSLSLLPVEWLQLGFGNSCLVF